MNVARLLWDTTDADPDRVALRDDRAWPVDAGGDEPVLINYTSGSTGGPKGVVTSHDNLLVGIQTVVGDLGIAPDDRIASLLPFSFVYGFNQLDCAVATGATLDIIGTPMAPEIVRALVRRESTVLAGIPPIWMQLLRVADFGEPTPSLRLMTCAGGRFCPEGVEALRAAQPQAKLYLMYGLELPNRRRRDGDGRAGLPRPRRPVTGSGRLFRH